MLTLHRYRLFSLSNKGIFCHSFFNLSLISSVGVEVRLCRDLHDIVFQEIPLFASIRIRLDSPRDVASLRLTAWALSRLADNRPVKHTWSTRRRPRWSRKRASLAAETRRYRGWSSTRRRASEQWLARDRPRASRAIDRAWRPPTSSHAYAPSPLSGSRIEPHWLLEMPFMARRVGSGPSGGR